MSLNQKEPRRGHEQCEQGAAPERCEVGIIHFPFPPPEAPRFHHDARDQRGYEQTYAPHPLFGKHALRQEDNRQGPDAQPSDDQAGYSVPQIRLFAPQFPFQEDFKKKWDDEYPHQGEKPRSKELDRTPP
jgi:hypothetical protein